MSDTRYRAWLALALSLVLAQLRVSVSAEPPAEASAPSSGKPRTMLAAGFGATQRVLRFSAADADRVLDTGFVPALGVQLGASFGDEWSLDVRFAYRSSVFATAHQSSPDEVAPPLETTIQTHELIAGLGPTLHLGDEDDPAFSLLVAYGIRAFGSVVELRIPRFSLHGPLARLEAELPLGSRRFVLYVGPELQWIVSLTSAARESARTERWGTALGFEARVCAYLLDNLALELAYRESHAKLSSAADSAFRDVERFAFVDIVVRY
jgi:hypothetical protein